VLSTNSAISCKQIDTCGTTPYPCHNFFNNSWLVQQKTQQTKNMQQASLRQRSTVASNDMDKNKILEQIEQYQTIGSLSQGKYLLQNFGLTILVLAVFAAMCLLMEYLLSSYSKLPLGAGSIIVLIVLVAIVCMQIQQAQASQQQPQQQPQQQQYQ